VSPGRYLAVLLAFGSQRLIELAYSRRNERRIRARNAAVPSAAASSFKWIVLTNAALFTLPAVERFLRRRHRVPAAVMAIGWLGALGGLGLRLSVLRSLGQAWTVRALVPADLPVVDRGPYRFIRHPNYLALGLEFAGLPLLGGAYGSEVLLEPDQRLASRRTHPTRRGPPDGDPGIPTAHGAKAAFRPASHQPLSRASHSRGVTRDRFQ